MCGTNQARVLGGVLERLEQGRKVIMAVNVALEFQVMENPGMMDYQSVRGLRQWSTCLGMEVLRVVDDWTPPVLTSSPSLMKHSPNPPKVRVNAGTPSTRSCQAQLA